MTNSPRSMRTNRSPVTGSVNVPSPRPQLPAHRIAIARQARAGHFCRIVRIHAAMKLNAVAAPSLTAVPHNQSPASDEWLPSEAFPPSVMSVYASASLAATAAPLRLRHAEPAVPLTPGMSGHGPLVRDEALRCDFDFDVFVFLKGRTYCGRGRCTVDGEGVERRIGPEFAVVYFNVVEQCDPVVLGGRRFRVGPDRERWNTFSAFACRPDLLNRFCVDLTRNDPGGILRGNLPQTVTKRGIYNQSNCHRRRVAVFPARAFIVRAIETLQLFDRIPARRNWPPAPPAHSVLDPPMTPRGVDGSARLRQRIVMTELNATRQADLIRRENAVPWPELQTVAAHRT
jgi:hypothetical protein